MNFVNPESNEFFTPPPTQTGGAKPLLRFYTDAVELPGRSTEEGRPRFEDRDFVSIINPGSRDELIRLAKDKAAQDPYVKAAYDFWKKTQQQPVDGTPISMVPWLLPSQIKELVGLNITTLEALAEISDQVKQRFHGSIALQRQAQDYLKSGNDTKLVTQLQSQLKERDNKIDLMQKQMDSMSNRFDEMSKKLETVK